VKIDVTGDVIIASYREAIYSLKIMTRQNLLAQAKMGDKKAIATLLNLALEHKLIHAEVDLQDDCLQVSLILEKVADPKIAIILVDRELQKIRCEYIQKIQIYGYEEDVNVLLWSEKFTPGDYADQKLSTYPQPETHEYKDIDYNPTEYTFSNVLQNLTPQPIDIEGWKSLAAGIFISIFMLNSQQLVFIFGYLNIIIHELGHAFTAWLFGYPAMPAFDFVYGGGVTSILEERSSTIVLLIGSAIAYLFYLARHNHFTIKFLGGLVTLYTICFFSQVPEVLRIFMGHGFELIFAGIFLYRGISGFACRYHIERPLYATLGLFTIFYEMGFARKLTFDISYRAMYEYGKGGLIDNDFVVLARDYLQVDLSTVATFYFLCCLITPVVTFCCYRYRCLWIYVFLKLVSRDGKLSLI
jgi:hypothetical protein